MHNCIYRVNGSVQPKMGLQVKKFAAQKIVVKYLSFLGGDSRPLASKLQLRYTQLYTGRVLGDHHLIFDYHDDVVESISNLNTFRFIVIAHAVCDLFGFFLCFVEAFHVLYCVYSIVYSIHLAPTCLPALALSFWQVSCTVIIASVVWDLFKQCLALAYVGIIRCVQCGTRT